MLKKNKSEYSHNTWGARHKDLQREQTGKAVLKSTAAPRFAQAEELASCPAGKHPTRQNSELEFLGIGVMKLPQSKNTNLRNKNILSFC